jgi:P4 family phage/plasmid primase-like protien
MTWFAKNGFLPEVISVIPPSATLSPKSKISASSLGKVPGIKYDNGTWGGYNWRTHPSTVGDIEKWVQDGANFGLRAGKFPGLDIDSLDPDIAMTVRKAARDILGIAPVRTGRAPKCLLMYRTDIPFARMRLKLTKDGVEHLIEMLGNGQQFLIAGTHPATLRPYEWSLPMENVVAPKLKPVTQERVQVLFDKLRFYFEGLGFSVVQEGDGRKVERSQTVEQTSLLAPSTEKLAEVVAAIPNSGERFKDRDSYIKMGAAIKAAAGVEHEEDGFDIFMEWCSRWEEGQNEYERVRTDWRRLYPPYAVGFGWLADTARECTGYNTAQDDFEVDPSAVPPEPAPPAAAPKAARPQRLADWQLARVVTERIGDRLRYVAPVSKWLVWTGSQWKPDATLLAQAEIGAVLQDLASQVSGPGAAAERLRIGSWRTLSSVMALVRADRTIAVSPDSLDSNLWELSTPGGVVDLRTGKLQPAQPESLHTKSTSVVPSGECPQWLQFLQDATGGDQALIDYLQRFAGYCLTGSVSEQILVFVYGKSGTGKSTFIDNLAAVLGDYAAMAGLNTFSATKGYDRHTTELAGLMGARLVTASETQEGRHWDEQKVKSLTGGDRIRARFMRADDQEFQPRFKLLLVGNHAPNIRTLDDAIKRRLHVVPFAHAPTVVDRALKDVKLPKERPGILAWMVEGCLKWQREGLNPPAAVIDTTATYFREEDQVGRWLEERCDIGGSTDLRTLFTDFSEWARESHEYIGTAKRLAGSLRLRGIAEGKNPETRRMEFSVSLRSPFEVTP